ncbi:MAG: hypothetical protein Q4C02_04160, partial [Eubacteriales bacterium]|nr:hypothetical protein [Eubacteriales bacterium]
FILHRAIPVTSVVGYARKKGNSLHRGYNPAMKNKRSVIDPSAHLLIGIGKKRIPVPVPYL